MFSPGDDVEVNENRFLYNSIPKWIPATVCPQEYFDYFGVNPLEKVCIHHYDEDYNEFSDDDDDLGCHTYYIKDVRHPEVQYDPTQQGDREDDI